MRKQITTETCIPPSLVEAFHKTRYTVHAPNGDFVMRIGEHSVPLQQLMARRRQQQKHQQQQRWGLEQGRGRGQDQGQEQAQGQEQGQRQGQGQGQQHCCALLTAYNPEARPAGQEANAANQRQLEQAVNAMALPYWAGENVPADGKGPVEPNVLILGLDRQQAYALALQFRQLAFVYADERAVPELVWVDIKAADRTAP